MSNLVSASSTPIWNNFSIERQLSNLCSRFNSAFQATKKSIQAAYTKSGLTGVVYSVAGAIKSSVYRLFAKIVYSDEQLTDKFEKALRNKDHHQLELLSTVMNRINKGVLEEALKAAAEAGELNVVRLLLKNKTFSAAGVNMVLWRAAEHGHLDMVGYLLKNKTFSEYVLEKGLCFAAINGRLNVIRFLLLGDRSFSAAGVTRALEAAAEHGQLDVVQDLLDDRSFRKFQLENALEAAAKHGQLDVIKYLLDNTIFSDSALEKALSAASRGHLNVVQFLLKNKTFSKAALENSLESAAMSNRLNIIRVLLVNTTFDDPALNQAFHYAALCGCLDVVEFLDNRSFSEPFLNYTLSGAARRGRLNIVQYFLAKKSFTDSALKEALRYAVKNGHHELYDILSIVIASDTGRVATIQDRDRLILLLAKNGHVECLDRLLRLGPIEDSLKNSIIADACVEVIFTSPEEVEYMSSKKGGYMSFEEFQRRKVAIIDMVQKVPNHP